MTAPQVSVSQSNMKLPKPKVRNAAVGAKPGEFYLAAVRRGRDRDYVPTDVWNELD
jgi:hypothetical protein